MDTVPAPDEAEPAFDPNAEPENDNAEEPFELEEKCWFLFPTFSDEFGTEVVERYQEHMDWWNGSAYANCVLTAYRAYHSLTGATDDPQISLMEGGESGELLSMDINNYRGSIKHQLAMITADRPSWEAQARTNDADALRQVPMTNNLLDFALREGLIKQLCDQLEMSKPTGAGFWVGGWDASAGLNKTGWFTSRVIAPWEMAHERVRDYDNDCGWWIYRAFESRWKWIAKYAKSDPEKARKIYALDQSLEQMGIAPIDGQGGDLVAPGGDQLAVLHVIVKPGGACPEGRLAIVCSDGMVLDDGPLPFGDTLPVTRICPAEFVGTSIPFSDTWMMLAPCEAISGIVSAIMTRIDMFSIPNVGTEVGSEFLPGDMGGANVIERLPGTQAPTALDLMHLPKELFDAAGMLKKIVEEASGVNSVTRGQPTENITSGSMAALMQAMAVQYNSTDERAWVLNLERVATILVKIFQHMANEDVLVSICGKDKQYTASSFKKDDVAGILRVGVKVSNPVTKTSAGRMQMAETMMQNHMFQSPAEYLQVIETGTLEPTFAGPVSYLQLVKSENEAMARGEDPGVILWDNDQFHISNHLVELNSGARKNQQHLQAIQKHVQDHFNNWQKKTLEQPDFLAVIGQPPLPQAQMVQQQGQAMKTPPGAPPAQPATQPGPQQQHQPNTDAPKHVPGPPAQPPGQQPSQAAPKQPEPAKTPGGEAVV